MQLIVSVLIIVTAVCAIVSCYKKPDHFMYIHIHVQYSIIYHIAFINKIFL